MVDIEGLFEVAIDGRPYRAFQELHQRRFLDIIRQQADSGGEPSERTLNPEDLWRRSQSSWVLGAGQTLYDGEESVRRRYSESEGIDPWEEGEVGLLNVVDRVDSGASVTRGKAVIADGKLFVNTVANLLVWDGSTWSNTSGHVQNIVDIASDGANVYLAERNVAGDAGKVTVVAKGTSSAVVLNDLIPDSIAYVRGRLMVSAGASLYNILDVGSTDAPSALTAAAINEFWQWDTLGAGQQFIYAAGHSDQMSMIYRITIREDGTGLTAPVAAAQMPDGEYVTAITSYLGVVLLGTTKGLRVAIPQGGSLQYGPLIETSKPVRAIEGQGRFVWFGDDAHLRRADLSRFLPSPLDLTPASALDLDAGGAGEVTGVFTWEGKRLFVVEDQGVYLEDPTTVLAQGHIDSGKITYALSDIKQFMFIDVRGEIDTDETIEVHVSLDGGAWELVGTLTEAEPRQSIDISTRSGDYLNVRFTLKATHGLADGPLLTRFTLRSFPSPRRTEQIRVVIDLSASLLALNQSVKEQDVWAEFKHLQSLVRSGAPITYQEFGESWTASIENVQWGPDLKIDNRESSWEGPCQVTLKVYQQ